MASTATITKSGQITLPKWARDFLGVKPGERVALRKNVDKIEVAREKNAHELAEEIRSLIPEEARKWHMEHYAGMTSAEMQEKWENSDEGRAYYQEEMERCL